MKDYIVTIHNEIKIDKKKLTLNKDDEDFLLDKEHPYFGMKNKENGLLIFNIWKNIGYGIFKNNLMSIIEERISCFSGSLFNNKLIRGIYLYMYNESLFLYLLRKSDKDIVPRLNDMKGKELVSEDENYPAPPRPFIRSPILRVQREEDSQPRENPSVTYYNNVNYTTTTDSNTISTSTGIARGHLGESITHDEAVRMMDAQTNERDNTRRQILAQREREENQRENQREAQRQAQRQAERYLERTSNP